MGLGDPDMVVGVQFPSSLLKVPNLTKMPTDYLLRGLSVPMSLSMREMLQIREIHSSYIIR